MNDGSFSSSVKITNVVCFVWNRTSNIDIENELFEVAESTLEENIFSFVKMKSRPSRTMSVIIGWLFIAAVVSVPFVNGQQCDCASSVPKCRPLPAQNGGLDSPCKKVPRSDCPCCLVCAGQLDDPCYPESQPCDTYKGLICDSTTEKCVKGKHRKRNKSIHPKWQI